MKMLDRTFYTEEIARGNVQKYKRAGTGKG